MYDWIQVDDEMPSNPGEVMLTWDGNELSPNTYYDRFREKWKEIDPDDDEIERDYPGKITHWFKFPEPPFKKKRTDIIGCQTAHE